ncbi:MAG: D-alanyl-D-alanine carboxypeptidase/D-alanyl-D-alanine-endopeptidase [Rheinheimera sp.]|nr:MAG: D-alanyl-D-alanine carboxypeptidase/D-alanyl-D-alanine-endopeptidase [Rheinheimera sp.]
MFKPAVFILALMLSGCASQPGLQLRHDLQQQILAAGLQPDQVALVVLPVAPSDNPATARPLIQHNADILLQPASTLKLLTSAVALDQLGPLWRGETELLADAADLAEARQTGILTKPLYLKGKGDPDLDYAAVLTMLSELHNEGVRELRAGVILDRSWFSPSLPDPAAAAFDESPRARYNYIPDALGLNQQMLQLQLRSDATSVQLSSLPLLTDLTLISELQLTDARCDQFNADLLVLTERQRPDIGVELVLNGEFPRNCLHQEEAAWLSRDLLWQLSLSQAWRQLGGRLAGVVPVAQGQTPTDAVVVAQHFSRPLPQLLQQLNKNSDNGLARTLALQLGRLAPTDANQTQPDSAVAAEQYVRQWLAQRQLPTEGLMLDNGSGLSRLARISASQLAALLQYAWQQPWGLDLASSLPRAGVDGTLQNRMRTTTARDSARLKTGTLRNGTGLAGYVFDRQHRAWIFVGLVNAEQGVAKGRLLLDQWVEQVSQF